MKNIIFIVGPTASGKTQTAFYLAQSLKGEIISADSMSVYKDVPIITASPSQTILKKIKHHFVGTISVKESYNVYDYYRAGLKLIKELCKKNIPIIICGGSGLYVKALLDGIFEGPVSDLMIREQLIKTAENKGIDFLYQDLLKIDKEAALKIAPQDKRRIVRALEVYYSSGETISKKQKEAKGIYDKKNCRLFGLSLNRRELYDRIDKRCEEMFNMGAVEEVKNLESVSLSQTASKIIGIKEIGDFLDGIISRDEALSLMQKNTRNFAKRQMTWFNKDKRVEWIDVDNMAPQEISKEITKRINEH